MKNDCKMIRIRPIPMVDAHPGMARSVYNLKETTTKIPKE